MPVPPPPRPKPLPGEPGQRLTTTHGAPRSADHHVCCISLVALAWVAFAPKLAHITPTIGVLGYANLWAHTALRVRRLGRMSCELLETIKPSGGPQLEPKWLLTDRPQHNDQTRRTTMLTQMPRVRGSKQIGAWHAEQIPHKRARHDKR